MAYKSYEDYLKRLKRASRKISYGNFVKERLRDSTEELKAALARAKSDAFSSSVGYGKTAEALSDKGLLENAGYSEYLGELSRKNYEAAVASAEKKQKDEQLAADSEYKEYERDYNDKQTKLVSKVIKDIDKLSITTYNDMLDYAAAAGLSEEYAKSAAGTAHAALTERLKQKVVDLIVNKLYGEKKTYDYAIKIGLDESVAKELSEYAGELRKSEINGDYLAGLKNKQ